jgi:Kef-type K+ transport system membrane component KefB
MQVLVTAVVVGLVAHFVSGLPGPASIVIGNGLALSSTAVVLQVAEFSLNSSISAFSN